MSSIEHSNGISSASSLTPAKHNHPGIVAHIFGGELTYRDGQECYAFTVALINVNRVDEQPVIVPWVQGVGNDTMPTAEAIMESLSFDYFAEGERGTFEDWAADYGDPDSRALFKSWEAVNRINRELERLIGRAGMDALGARFN